jgi:hypothetical protein
MGVGYTLVNYTKKEMVMFSHIPAEKARELAGNPISATMTTWYLLQNLGDEISFVSDTYDDWPFPNGSKEDMNHYQEVTEQLVDSLINVGILKDEGKEWADEEEPELIYMRALKNVWMA